MILCIVFSNSFLRTTMQMLIMVDNIALYELSLYKFALYINLVVSYLYNVEEIRVLSVITG